MSTINEIPRVHQWIKEMLAANATLLAAVPGGIHRGRVPHGRTLPAVVYSFLSANEDLRGGGSARIWVRARYIVKVVSETDNDLTIQTIADLIDTTLHTSQGGTSDITIDYCIRIRPVYYQEDSVTKRVFTHLGGEYEIAARYTP